MKNQILFALCFFCIVLLAGCSNGNIKATGVVVFDDGTPLTKGNVVFQSPQHQYTGTIGQDGTFRLGGVKPGNGLPSGTYNVALSNVNTEEELVINAKYAVAEASGISFEITKGSREPLRVVVTRP